MLHWAHTVWSWIPDVPTPLSLVVILAVLVTVTITSVLPTGRLLFAIEYGNRVSIFIDRG